MIICLNVWQLATRNSQLATRNSQLATKVGFTLVELSIVIVIIGLLIGGVLVGQNLIESAKLNAQVKQFQQYDIATRNFIQKYNQWPGDSTYFPHNPDPIYQIGNGNGYINDHSGNIPPNALLDEPSQYFSHLYVSGSIQEPHAPTYRIGSGAMPEVKLAPKRGMTVTMNSQGILFYFVGIYQIIGNAMSFMQMSPSGIMSATTAMAIDAKMDDGLPRVGNIVAVVGYAYGGGNTSYYPHPFDTTLNGCTSSATAYNINNTSDTACRLLVKSEASK
jgi:prepilin-type N-terminal cleavage/methylation domain-containing protein